MRIVKEYEERRKEILETAERLFLTKGYTKTTVNDILKEIGIAKGTFYHYFKSKEEVMDEIIIRIIKEDVAKAKVIVSNPNIPVLEKLFRVLMEQSPKSGDIKDKMIEQFHQPNNAEMHQKSLVQSIIHLSPLLTEILEQGIEEGIFSTSYPQETIELLLSSAQVIFDDGLFQWKPEEMMRRVKAYIKMMEVSVGAKEGSFNYMLEVLMKQK
ncbi:MULTISPECIES: TetR/AcrR family transcriptional regulator [unclassified Bacillus cereus group]|uniref:TetR/AcrR family transcriptional regulator n=1 Tax=unclassified Bacillus cereus group TaxID=2750818 RepID=UPI0022E9527B|nr:MULTISPECIES: TetR/AcrR family transcriptional regulator [unclassified Bacillus cereus group]MDA2665241.1 TetR/AcrR family transcriptional regulator [Bacillus cereus group sp. Bc032]MDA2676028.1 TetR/AcrR family transcriptional regulator [Bacillus cereus group sp. Bc031]MDA2681511.1 TetR/AcrR family transcriptional regulator [Bacillus cereus group sp. Bc029]MDA2686967.1 TetR/AcrR family transcriptional regulator [Bacillus cereus group sp. Bc030]MDA2742480.1 TetR/AcrR family transcriptional 